MAGVPACLGEAIRSYRAQHEVPELFAGCLHRLETVGFDQARDPAASVPEIRWIAADFILHYIGLALDDHRISEREMGNILALKRIYDLDEGDLLALQENGVADLLRLEMAQILADEQTNDMEAIHQANLQRALGLGYDQYLRLTRENIRPIVDRMLNEAKGRDEQQKNVIIRKLQALQTVLRVDSATMTAIWPN